MNYVFHVSIYCNYLMLERLLEFVIEKPREPTCVVIPCHNLYENVSILIFGYCYKQDTCINVDLHTSMKFILVVVYKLSHGQGFQALTLNDICPLYKVFVLTKVNRHT